MISNEMTVIFGGITFHWYGFFVGLALIIGWQLIELRYKIAKKNKESSSELVALNELEKMVPIVLISGLVGARFWHVITDWELYRGDLRQIFFVWQGGMSILGAVFFAVLSILAFSWYFYPDKKYQAVRYFLDLFAFGLPVGQAIGRVGNWVNQELYGLPTTLPWGIPISLEARVSGYEQFDYFHPLFAYEALAMLVLAAWLWWNKHSLFLQIGRGRVAACYFLYYSLVRFLLEFLRIDKAMFSTSSWGVNQLVMIAIFIASAYWLVRSTWHVKK